MIDALLSHTFNGIDLWLLPVAALSLAYYFRCIPTIRITRSES